MYPPSKGTYAWARAGNPEKQHLWRGQGGGGLWTTDNKSYSSFSFGGGKGAKGALDVCPGVCRRLACAKEPPAPPWRTTRGVLRGKPLVFMCHGEEVALLWTNARICMAPPFPGTSRSPAVFHLQESSFPVGHWFHSKRPEPCLLQARVSWAPGWTREFLGGAAFNLLRNIHHPV